MTRCCGWCNRTAPGPRSSSNRLLPSTSGGDPGRQKPGQQGKTIMLDARQIAAASAALRDQWRHGTKFANLPSSVRPQDRIDGYAIQAELERQSSAALFGWKIAATSEAGQRHINVAGPMAGRILAETVLADGGTPPMAVHARGGAD